MTTTDIKPTARRRTSGALLNDIRIIAARLRQEAYEREWCEEYNDVMRDLNRQTSEPWMELLDCGDDDE